jgi:AraC-like DNA-binding protein
LDKDILREPIIHGEFNFPISVYYKNKLNSDINLLYHWHDEVEFLYINKGSGVFKLDNSLIELDEEETLFVNSGVLHSGNISTKDNELTFTAVVFDLNMLNSNFLGLSQNKILIPLINKKYSIPTKFTKEDVCGNFVLKYLKKIINDFRNEITGFEFSIFSSLYNIFYYLSKYNKFIENKKIVNSYEESKIEQLKKTLLFIKENYRKKINLIELSKTVNMSQYHFCRFFKSMVGKTPFVYLIEYRIYAAEKLLINSDKRIIDIALEVGFNNIGYFIKKFKEIKGITPSKFRSNLK